MTSFDSSDAGKILQSALPKIAAQLLALPPVLFNYLIAMKDNPNSWQKHIHHLDAALLVLERDDLYSLSNGHPCLLCGPKSATKPFSYGTVQSWSPWR